MIMSLLVFLAYLIVAGVIIWGARAIVNVLPMDAVFKTVILVVITVIAVVIVVYALLGLIGGASLALPRLR
jgi:hypothetical protein